MGSTRTSNLSTSTASLYPLAPARPTFVQRYRTTSTGSLWPIRPKCSFHRVKNGVNSILRRQGQLMCDEFANRISEGHGVLHDCRIRVVVRREWNSRQVTKSNRYPPPNPEAVVRKRAREVCTLPAVLDPPRTLSFSSQVSSQEFAGALGLNDPVPGAAAGRDQDKLIASP